MVFRNISYVKQEVSWMTMHTTFWSPNLMGRNLFKDLDIDDRIILKGILKKQDGRM
jgi:hypothetical protein